MLALVIVAVNLPQSVVVPVLPSIQASYGTDQVTATWLITGFLLTSAIATPVLGRLGDSYGSRRILTIALLVLVAGCVGAALAPTIGWAIAMRAVQGVCGGAVPLAFAALRVHVPPERLGHGVAVLATVSSVAFSLGIVAAGPLLERVGRASVFLLPAVVALVALAGVLRVLPAHVPPAVAPGRFSAVAVVTFSTALVALLLAIGQSTQQGATAPAVLGLYAVTVLSTLAWVRSERRAVVAFIDLAMMRTRGMWTANVVAFLAGVGLFGCAAGLPQLLRASRAEGGLGASLDEVGLLMSPVAAAAFVVSLGTAPILRVVTTRTLVLVGALTSGASFVGLALWHDDRLAVLAWCAIQGVGNGLLLSSVATVVVAAVPPHQTGVANGMNTNLRIVGGSLGAAATAAIIQGFASGGQPTEGGFVTAFLVMAAAMGAAALTALLVPPTGGSGYRFAREPSTELRSSSSLARASSRRRE